MAAVVLVGIPPGDAVADAIRRAGHDVRAARVATGTVPSIVVAAAGAPAGASADLADLYASLPAGAAAASLVLLRPTDDDCFEPRVIGGVAARPAGPLDADGVAALVTALAEAASTAARTSPPGSAPVAISGIVLDPVAHTVHRSGRPVRLNPREFDLLAYLMRHAGEVVYREQLLAAVWRDGPADPARSQTHAVHMRWLRQKLERDPSRPEHLLTVRRVGYMFRP